VKDSTVGQRISRAKRTVTEEGLEFELPTGAERESRLSDVLAVVYLVFTEGHTATAGHSWARADLCYEAVRLARLLADLVSAQSEVHALQALLELQASRLPARVDDRGEAVLLERQDRGRWDQLLIQRGLSALTRAEASADGPGQYLLQAQIAACHARASSAAATDWSRIAELYDQLEHLQPNPVVTLNRAVAHGRAYGPDSGLAILESLGEHSALARSPMLPAVRGDLFQQAGRHAEAATEFLQAAGQTRNEAERALLLRRATEFS
jgi:predicted RNA polymerase sigma factor